MVRLKFSIELLYEVLQPTDFVFRFHAAETVHQTILRSEARVSPELPYRLEVCDQFGNLGMRLHSGPGPLSVFYDATVDCRDTRIF